MHDDNHDNSESESSSDNESLVSESSNSEILDFEGTETSSEADENHVHQNSTTSFATSAGITWDLLDPNHNHSGRLSSHNVIREAPGPSAQARLVFSKNRFTVHGIDLLMKVYCVVYKDVPKKRLEEFYKQMTGACRYMNWMHF